MKKVKCTHCGVETDRQPDGDMLEFIKSVLAEQLSHGSFGDAEYISKAQKIVSKIEGEAKAEGSESHE